MGRAYIDSKGKPHEIADMPYTHLKNSLAKLKRDPRDATRYATDSDLVGTIEAMQAELDRRDAEYAATQAARGEAGEA